MSENNDTPVSLERIRYPLGYAKRGWHVFPVYEITAAGHCACPAGPKCGNPGKHPRTPNGFKAATVDPKQIHAWHARWPNANWAIACGPSRLAVVDVDPRNQGDQSLADLEKKHGEMPLTIRACTGGGGQHYLYSFPDGVDSMPSRATGHGIEIKATGGYIVVAPSNHVSGKTYTWDSGAHPRETEVTVLPKWWQEFLGSVAKTHQFEQGGEVADGFLGACFELMGWLGGPLGPDKARAYCPWEGEHSAGVRYDSSTVVFAPRKGRKVGWFHCSHGHCDKVRTLAHVLAQIPEETKAKARAKLGLDPQYSPEAEAVKPIETSNLEQNEWAGVLRYNSTGTLTKDAGNAAAILANLEDWRGCLQYDVFADRMQWVRPVPYMPGLAGPSPGNDLADHHVTYVHHWLAKCRGVSFPKTAIQDALESAARSNEVHPVREYLGTLRWDGKQRLPTWLQQYLGAPELDYVSVTGKWWMISAVARVMHPGCQADHLLVLEGGQGTGKSTAARILGGAWFLANLPDITSKDAAQVLRGHWISEIGELDAFKGAAGTRVKDWVSRTTDSYRPAYGRYTINQPRQCVFFGTTNEHQYLTDASGARRFWPVAVTKLLRSELMLDRDQLWAEALVRWESGENWWPDEDMIPALSEAQDERYAGDEWEQQILEWYERIEPPPFTVADVLVSVLNVERAKWDRPLQTRIGSTLRKLGFSVRQCRENGGRVRRYSRPLYRDGESGSEGGVTTVPTWHDVTPSP